VSGGRFGGGGGTELPEFATSTRAGNWYTPSAVVSTGDNFLVPTQDRLYLTLPRVTPVSITVDALSVDLNIIGGAGAVLRVGIYLVDSEDRPYDYTFGLQWATLLAAGDTTATDGTTGRKTITLGTPAVVPAGRAFSIAAVDQIAAPASRRMRIAPTTPHPWGMPSNSWTPPHQVLSTAGVTGALPPAFTPAQSEVMVNSSDHGVQWRRSA
jgi:hypothetical protein